MMAVCGAYALKWLPRLLKWQKYWLNLLGFLCFLCQQTSLQVNEQTRQVSYVKYKLARHLCLVYSFTCLLVYLFTRLLKIVDSNIRNLQKTNKIFGRSIKNRVNLQLIRQYKPKSPYLIPFQKRLDLIWQCQTYCLMALLATIYF